MTNPSTRAPAVAASPTLWALRVAAVLAVAVLLYQGVTAGTLIADPTASLGPHGFGAYLTHGTAGLAAVLAGVLIWQARRRGDRAPLWPAGLAVVAFAFGFVLAYLGSYGPVAAHVPAAVLLIVASSWLVAWTFSAGARRLG